ncbi:hypothetical protein GF356_08115 [candidate division GN15 bacterium]|nr:hypothetical protein [candidate division GN15 bacterium]
MAHAYTPGLKVTENLLIRKRRILPLKGEVVVKVGDKLNPNDVVARTHLPGNVVPLNVANKLGVPPEDLSMVMQKKEGDPIKEGEQIALKKSFIKWFSSSATATIDGTIESISNVTGQVLQRGEPIPVEVTSYVKGTVAEVIENEGVVMETYASFVQGIFGIGGETFGDIQIAVDNNSTVLEDKLITNDMKDKVIVGGAMVTAAALKKAIEVGVRGIVVGGFDDKDLRDFLGYDIGVAITGNEDIGISLVVTEGFGQIDMAKKTFDLLSRHQGEMACINGATQIRAGVIRPEVVIPTELNKELEDKAANGVGGLATGSPIRVIRHPYFGYLGEVTDLPAPLQVLESESKARVLKVKFDDGTEVIVPRANVEMIEG